MAVSIDPTFSFAFLALVAACLMQFLRDDHPALGLLFLINSVIFSLVSVFSILDLTKLDAPNVYTATQPLYAVQWFVVLVVLIYFFIQIFKGGLMSLGADKPRGPRAGV